MCKKNLFSSAALAGFCAALMLACKETAVIHFFALGWPPPFSAGVFSRGGKNSPPARKSWLTAIASLFMFTSILLFTWGGQNWPALADLLRAIPNFAARAGGEGHEKPFWYYARLLAGGWSGAVILALAAIGIFPRDPSTGFATHLPGDLCAADLCDLQRDSLQNAVACVEFLAAAGDSRAASPSNGFGSPSPKFSARAVILIVLAGAGFLIGP